MMKMVQLLIMCILTAIVTYAAPVRGETLEPGGNNESPDEEEEIIEMLDMLEQYDLLKSMEMYSNMDEIENMNSNNIEAGDKEVAE